MCEQEAAESIVMAERMNGMVQSANLPETIADVDRTALLGGEPAERACGVDEGDGTECEGKSWLQEIELLCKESCQRNRNTMDDIPSARKLPLVGEWTVCASGKASNLEVKPADSSNELETLAIVSIELEGPDGSEIPHVRLGGTSCRVGDVNCLGCRTDGSRSQADGSTGQTDASNASNGAETAGMSKGEGADTYLGARGTKCSIRETDGVGSQTDVST